MIYFILFFLKTNSDTEKFQQHYSFYSGNIS